MSYSFSVRKVNGTLEMAPGSLEAIAKHVPDGAVFTINGHTPGADTSAVGQIGITLSVSREDGTGYEFLGSGSGSYTTKPIAT